MFGMFASSIVPSYRSGIPQFANELPWATWCVFVFVYLYFCLQWWFDISEIPPCANELPWALISVAPNDQSIPLLLPQSIISLLDHLEQKYSFYKTWDSEENSTIAESNCSDYTHFSLISRSGLIITIKAFKTDYDHHSAKIIIFPRTPRRRNDECWIFPSGRRPFAAPLCFLIRPTPVHQLSYLLLVVQRAAE